MVRVLFVCVHNAARSQMAEAFLNALGKGSFEAESAGLEPGALNPLIVEAMAEIGYDISGNSVDSVFRFLNEGRKYDLVIKVCDRHSGQRCPIFPGAKTSLSWDFPDPAAFDGTHEEKLAKARALRDQIRARIEALISVYQPG